MIDLSSIKATLLDGTLIGIKFFDNNQTANVTGAIIKNYPTPGLVEFILYGVVNPLSTAQNRIISIQTIHPLNAMIIDQGNFSLTSASPTNFPFTQLTVTDTTVSERASYQIEFYLNIPVLSGCQISIIFPTQEFNLQTDGISDVQISGILGPQQTIAHSISSNTLILNNACKQDFYSSSSNRAIIKINGIKNPPVAKLTNLINLLLKDTAGGQIAQTDTSSNKLQFNSSLGSVYLGNIQILDTTATNTLSKFKFSFTPQHTMTSNYQIEFQLFDTDYQIQSSLQIDSSTIPNIASVSIVSSGQKIQLRDFTSAINTGTQYDIVFSKILTAQSQKQLSTIQITISQKILVSQGGDGTTYYGAAIGIFSGNYFTPSPGLFYLITASSGATRAAESTIFYFQIKAQNPIPLGGYLLLYYPNSITSPQQYSCQKDGVQTECQFTQSTRVMKFYGLAKTSNYPANTVINLRIANVNNPRSPQASTQFKVETYDKYDLLVDTSDNSSPSNINTVITPTEPSYFSQTKVQTSSSTVGATGVTYTFSFTTPSFLINGDILKITIPDEITLPTITQVKSDQISGTVQYSRQGDKIILITLAFGTGTIFAGGKVLSVGITGFNNRITTQASSSFILELFQNDNKKISVLETQDLIVQLKYPATITSGFSIQNFPLSPRTVMEVKISFNTLHQIPQNSKIIITYPKLLMSNYFSISASIQSPAHASNTSLQLTNNIAAGQLILQNISPQLINPNQQVQLQFYGFVNADSSSFAETFKLDILTQENYQIDSITSNLIVTVKCDYPCGDCIPAASKKQCTACLSKTQFSPLNVLQNKECVSSCIDGYYLLSNSSAPPTCQKCHANCTTCYGTPTNCTSCARSSKIPALFNNTCLAETACPQGYFYNRTGGQCSQCSQNCLNCTGSSTECTYCPQYLSLFNKTCIQQCPSDITIANTTNRTCMSCDSRCKTCKDNRSKCTSCIEGLRLNPFTNVCDKYCPELYTVEERKGFCDECTNDCVTCQTFRNRCMSCQPGYFLSLNQCLSRCASSEIYYSNACQSCADGCSTCKVNPQNCTECQIGYFSYMNSCYLRCPKGTNADFDSRQCVNITCPTGYEFDSKGDCSQIITNIQDECSKGQEHNWYFEKCINEAELFIPFPILIFLAIMTLILVIFVKCKKYKQVNLLQTIICMWAIFELPIFAAQIVVCILYEHWIPTFITCGAIGMFYILNLISGCQFHTNRQMDQNFVIWSQDKHPNSYKRIVNFSILYNQKLLRLFTCGFMDRKYYLASFTNIYVFFTSPIRSYSFWCILLVYTAIAAADIFIIITFHWFHYIFIIAIETLVFVVIMTILMYADYLQIKSQYTIEIKIIPKMTTMTIGDQQDDHDGPDHDHQNILMDNRPNEHISLLSQIQKDQEKDSSQNDQLKQSQFNSDRSPKKTNKVEKGTDEYKTGEFKEETSQTKKNNTTFKQNYDDLPPINLNKKLMQFYEEQKDDGISIDYVEDSPEKDSKSLNSSSSSSSSSEKKTKKGKHKSNETNIMEELELIKEQKHHNPNDLNSNNIGYDQTRPLTISGGSLANDIHRSSVFSDQENSKFLHQPQNNLLNSNSNTPNKYPNNTSNSKSNNQGTSQSLDNSKFKFNEVENNLDLNSEYIKPFDKPKKLIKVKKQENAANNDDHQKENEPLNFQPKQIDSSALKVDDFFNDDSQLQIQIHAKKRQLKKKAPSKDQEKQELIQNQDNQDQNSPKDMQKKQNNFLD
ncbi:UNKNOWN [Stylonychia lemnae]|uniref:TNFR-Cys domain-containing protein n=1 Tax=Stylonychia lemnae TaxID=5949 RepID=A0A078A7L9_STYLE|nr:UNKNOWN [Stylonychia lemnae]|eukprot:CDW77557.1 UNKNOWN [Stylonychia lemnae]